MSVDITISYILRVLLVFVFSRAALHKLCNFSHFNAQLRSYRLLPDPLLPAFSSFLIVVEGSLAFSLLVKGWLYPSFIAAAIFALYAGAMSINLIQGRDDLDCGCSGPSEFGQRVSWALVIRNCVLAIFSLATALPIASRSLSVLDIATVVFASIAVIFIYASIEQTIANKHRQGQYFAQKFEGNRGSVE
jgi:Methylamine utilisation protein MauE